METRTLGPSDIPAALEIRNRSFGMLSPDSRAEQETRMQKAIDERRTIGAYDGATLLGRALIWRFDQWWGGRVMPMAGVAGVVVAPEHRGRGVGGLLMDGMMARSRELGFPVSALYAATIPVYRQRGFEIGGSQHRVDIEARSLRELRGGSVRVREAGPDDAEEIVRLTREHYRRGRDNGVTGDDVDEVREELAEPGVFAYIAADGYVLYGWDNRDLVVYKLVADDPDTARALWAVVGSGSSIAKTVHAYVAPDDPLRLILGDGVDTATRTSPWMFRCIDAAAAVAARGFPAGVEIDVPLALDDVHVPDNQFSGRLAVAGGRGSLVAGEADPSAPRLSANGLAALFTGTPTSSLRAAGLISGGDPESHGQLDAAFAGRPAYLLDFF